VTSTSSEDRWVPDGLLRLAIEAAPAGIVMLDRQGRILLVNARVEALFGYDRAELLGQPVEMLIPERFREGHPADRDRFFAAPRARPMGAGRDLYGLRRDGTEVPVEIGLAPLNPPQDSGQGATVVASIVDITERRRTAERLESSLREKETLLREVHHRVKNNLQVISSLLGLQARHTDNVEAAATLAEANDRVHSIALAHEILYQGRDFARVDFVEYLRKLVVQLASTWGPRHATAVIDAPEALHVPLDLAVPCGLIVNELVSNSFKHAFETHRATGTQTGRIGVRVRVDGGDLRLEVSDDGAGLPSNVDLAEPSGIGLRLVVTLARQLAGRIEQVPCPTGTAICLTVPVSP
jgi:PAS domain S-box-containing protein